MTYTPIQLEAIKLFGKKDLTFGCWLFIQNPDGYAQFVEETDVGNGYVIFTATTGYSVLDEKSDPYKEYTIIGHEPHLEDVFRVAWGKGWEMLVSRGIKIWWLGDSEMNPSKTIKYNPTLPLIEQSESTLVQLISLFK